MSLMNNASDILHNAIKTAGDDIVFARMLWEAFNAELVAAGLATRGSNARYHRDMGYSPVEMIWDMYDTARQQLAIEAKTGRRTMQHTAFGRQAMQAETVVDWSKVEDLFERVIARLS